MCMMELGELEAHNADFARRNVRVVVTSLEGREDATKTQSDFPHLVVISDADKSIATALDLIHAHASPDGGDTVVPTTFLFDREGIVRWLYRPERYLIRLSTTELLAAIDSNLRGGSASTLGKN
jgi:alkyl hydroperoxide reductase subunit AhpC